LRKTVRAAALVGAACLAATAAPALAADAASVPTPLRVLTRDTLPAGWLTHPAGAPSPDAPWHVGVSLAGRNAAALAKLKKDQYTPGTPDYKHFLTPAEYDARFGAASADTAAVKTWLGSQGLDVRFTSNDGTYLVAVGKVSEIEKTFQTTLGSFTGAAGTPFASFTANTSAPTVPTLVTAVAGLDTLSVAHTHAITASAGRSSGAFPIPTSTDPKDLWSIYEQPSANTAQGQKLVAFGWGAPGTTESDLRSFEARNHLPKVPFTITQVGTPGTDTAGAAEWDLDSQAATGMAPSAAAMTFYFATSGSSDLLAEMIDLWADDPAGADQGSGSYGLCDAFGFLGTFDAHEAALTKATTLGRSFFASTGDAAAGCSAAGAGVNGVVPGPIPSPEYPSTSPNAIGVGGTVVYSTGDPMVRDREIAWTHTGGGSSSYFTSPPWQSALNPAYTAVGRATADVSAQSGDLLSGYNITVGGAVQSVGGTSLSAPLWQGMWARVSAASSVKDTTGKYQGPGFAAPLIYGLAADAATLATSFTDITAGSNGYPAATGYDIPTGWGVPRVTGLMKTLDGGNVTPVVTTVPVPPTDPGGGTTTLLPPCQPAPQIVDAAGDATQAVAADTTVTQASQKDLDLLSAGTVYDVASSAMVATIKVSDLSATPGNSENFRYDFMLNGVQYELSAQRSSAGATTYSWSIPGINSTSFGALTGSFDNTTSTVTIRLPAGVYKAAQPTKPAMTATSSFSGFSVLSQRVAGLLTATSDSAALTADCSYASSVGGPEVIVPEVPYAALIPMAGLVVFGGFLFRRRRQTV
jgi:subtilase family serine protease